MPEQENIQAFHQILEAFNSKDWDRFKTYQAPSCIYDEIATDRYVQGVDQYVDAIRVWTAAFPDIKGTVTSTYVSEDTVVAEITWDGTQSGALQMAGGELIPPTGKRSTLRAVQVVTFENGKTKAVRHYFDLMSMMRQLGLLPAPGRVQEQVRGA